MKKVLFGMAAVLLAALMLTGCPAAADSGGGDSGDGSVPTELQGNWSVKTDGTVLYKFEFTSNQLIQYSPVLTTYVVYQTFDIRATGKKLEHKDARFPDTTYTVFCNSYTINNGTLTFNGGAAGQLYSSMIIERLTDPSAPGGPGTGGEPSGPELPVPTGETIGPLALEELSTVLAGLPANTAANPHTIKLDSSVIIDTGDAGSGVWATINRTAQSARKYVILDLSECSAKGNLIEGAASPSGCKMNIIEDNQYLKGIVLPDSLASIGTYAFASCEWLASVTIPASVTRIVKWAFLACDGLTNVTVPVGLAGDFNEAYAGSIGLSMLLTGTGSVADNAFDYYPELVSVIIGPGVTGVRKDTFDSCANLAAVTVDEANNENSSADGVLFNKDKTSLLFCPAGRTGSYTIPSSVTSIESGAFYNCKGLTGALTIPSSVTSIGSGTFYNCIGLTGVTIPSGVTSIGSGAFYNCTGLTGVTIPESVASIGAYIFGSGIGAFDKCSGLTSITIPARLSAGFSAKFTGYSNLEVVLTGSGIVPRGAFDTTWRTSSNSWSDCTGITSVTIGDGVTSIGQSAFSGCTGITSVTIGNGVAIIGQDAFSGCAGLISLIIPDGVTTIWPTAFYGCSGLTSLTIGGGVTTIGPNAFSGCTGLTSLTIPDGVTRIDQAAFSGCTGLTSLKIGNGITSIGQSIFSGCSRLTSVTIPPSVETIGAYAFSGCIGLESVIIPNSIAALMKSLELLAQTQTALQLLISNHDFIKNLIIGSLGPDFIDGVSTIEKNAFDGCTKLTRVTFGGPAIYDHNAYESERLKVALGILVDLISLDGLEIIKDYFTMTDDINNNRYDRGFYDNAFPQGSSGAGGNALKTAYLAGGTGTYRRASTSANVWTKE